MSTFSQRSFAAGEIAPALYPRVDTSRYATGLKTCKNSIVLRHGGTANRPGTEFIFETKFSEKASRLIPFVFSNDQTLMLEFGDLYIRVHDENGLILDTAKNIAGCTRANPGVVTSYTHGFVDDQIIYIESVLGMTELNDTYFKVVYIDPNTFSLETIYGVTVNTTAYGTYTSGGTATPVVEIATTYTEAELFDIQYTQSLDVLTLVHPSHAPARLTRASNVEWGLADISFSTGGGVRGSASAAAGAKTWRYIISGIVADTLAENATANVPTLAGYENYKAINNGTAANPVVFTTTTSHGYATGDEVYLTKTLAWANNSIASGYYTVSAVGSATTFSIAYNTTGYGAWVGNSGEAQSYRMYVTVHLAPARSALSPTNPVTITWTHSSAYLEYNVYVQDNGIFYYLGTAAPVGSSGTVTFLDVGTSPSYNDSLPSDRSIFDVADAYPGVVGFFQQRQCYANTNDDHEAVFLSKIGAYSTFTYHSPLADDDSISFTIAGKQINEVRHILDVGNLVILTGSGEWAVLGDANGVVTPSGINPKQHGHNGASNVRPIVVGGNALFVQARGSIIRDLTYDFSSDGYKGNDLTVFSTHLFEGFAIVDWALQQVPNSIVWAVRSDGTLLGLTYVKDQDIIGWHQHDFGGVVESVATIPEGNEDALYLVVNRTIDGTAKRYIERMTSRYVAESAVKESIFMDCAVTFDGRNTTATTMTISGGTTWDAYETMTMTASASFFVAGDVGNEIHFTDVDGNVLFRFSIAAYTSATVVTGQVDRLVPVASRSVATTSWTRAVDQILGLDHLEGEQVSVFADGAVEASPNNPAYGTPLTVTAGTITLSQCYGLVHVGLPYISDIQTLDIDTAEGETLADKMKFVSKVTMHLEKSRGIWVGAKPPSDDATDALENLTEAKIRNLEGYNEPNDLFTGKLSVAIRPEWNSNGRVFIRQVDPLPVSVLAVSPAGLYPTQGGG